MTKRLQFTNTKKWTQAWFRKLKPEHKLFWLYINDMADHAGFYNIDLELAEVCIGLPLNEEKIMQVFNAKIKVLNEQTWWLKEYCIIQSKTLLEADKGNKAQQSAFNLLQQNGVYEEYTSLFYNTYPGLTKPKDSLKVKDKEELPVEEMKKGKVLEEGKGLVEVKYLNDDGEIDTKESLHIPAKKDYTSQAVEESNPPIGINERSQFQQEMNRL